jgi:hypothetical protein
LWSVFNAGGSRVRSCGQIQEWNKKVSLNAIWHLVCGVQQDIYSVCCHSQFGAFCA